MPDTEHGRKPLRPRGKIAQYNYLRPCEVTTNRGEGGNVMRRQKMGFWLREEMDELRIKEGGEEKMRDRRCGEIHAIHAP